MQPQKTRSQDIHKVILQKVGGGSRCSISFLLPLHVFQLCNALAEKAPPTTNSIYITVALIAIDVGQESLLLQISAE